MSINRQQNIIKANLPTVTMSKTNPQNQNERYQPIKSNGPNKLFSKKDTCHSSECENQQGQCYEGHNKENSKNRNNLLHHNEKSEHFEKEKESKNVDINSRKAKIPKLEIDSNQFKKVRVKKNCQSQMKYQSGQDLDESVIQTERLERLINKRDSKIMEQKTQRIGKQQKAQKKKNQAKTFVQRYLREHNRQELAQIMNIFDNLEKITENKLKFGTFSQQDHEIDNLIEQIEYFISEIAQKYGYSDDHSSEMEALIKTSDSQIQLEVSFAQNKKQCASVQTQMDSNEENLINKMKQQMEKEMEEYELKLVDIVEAVYQLKQTIQQLDDSKSYQSYQNEIVSSMGDNQKRQEDKRKQMSKNIKSWKEELNSILSSINNSKSKYGANQFGDQDTFKLQKQGYEIMKSPSKNDKKWLNRESSPINLPTEEHRIKPFSLNQSETNIEEDKAIETLQRMYLMFKDVYKFMLELLYYRIYECLKKENKRNNLVEDIKGMYKKYANMHLKCEQMGKNTVYTMMNSLSAFMGQLTGELGSIRKQWKLSTNI